MLQLLSGCGRLNLLKLAWASESHAKSKKGTAVLFFLNKKVKFTMFLIAA
jgi:hypothetical protein